MYIFFSFFFFYRDIQYITNIENFVFTEVGWTSFLTISSGSHQCDFWWDSSRTESHDIALYSMLPVLINATQQGAILEQFPALHCCNLAPKNMQRQKNVTSTPWISKALGYKALFSDHIVTARAKFQSLTGPLHQTCDRQNLQSRIIVALKTASKSHHSSVNRALP